MFTSSINPNQAQPLATLPEALKGTDETQPLATLPEALKGTDETQPLATLPEALKGTDETQKPKGDPRITEIASSSLQMVATPEVREEPKAYDFSSWTHKVKDLQGFLDRVHTEIALSSLQMVATPEVREEPKAYDFSSWTYKVKDLQGFLDRVHKDGKELKEAMKKISKKYQKEHTSLCVESTKPEFKPDVHELYPAYDKLRVLRDRPELGYVNASYIKTPGQNFILACCPQTEREAAAMFFALFKDPSDHQVWASVHAARDGEKEGKTKRLCKEFASDEVLARLQFPDGWKISNIEHHPKIMGTSVTKKDGSSAVPYLTETTITATNGERIKKVTCLRYFEWEDHCVVPDEDLCIKFIDRMHELSPDKTVDQMVNCIGGVGRSGMILVLYSKWNEIKEEGKKMPIDDVSFNFPPYILKLREDRMCLMDNLSHLAPMGRILQKLVAREKSAQAQC